MEEIFNQIEDIKETLEKIEDQANKNNQICFNNEMKIARDQINKL